MRETFPPVPCDRVSRAAPRCRSHRGVLRAALLCTVITLRACVSLPPAVIAEGNEARKVFEVGVAARWSF